MSKLDKAQIVKVLKTALYVALSAGISAVLTAIAGHPELFGVFTPIVNIALVFLKQLFTSAS